LSLREERFSCHVISGLLTAHARRAGISQRVKHFSDSWRRWLIVAGRCGFCCRHLDTSCSSSTRLDHHPPTRPSTSVIYCNIWIEQGPSVSLSNKPITTVFFATIMSGRNCYAMNLGSVPSLNDALSTCAPSFRSNFVQTLIT